MFPGGGEEDCSHLYSPGVVFADSREPQLQVGPHLFIDDYLIEESSGLNRKVCPQLRSSKAAGPIVTSALGDRCGGPYLTVLPSSETAPFRLFYNGFSNGHIALFGLKTWPDGIHWTDAGEQRDVPGPMKWGCSVIDEGEGFDKPPERYKLAWYAWATRGAKRPGGLMVATSADGLNWRLANRDPLIRHNHDIDSLYVDPIRKRYVYTFSTKVESSAAKEPRRVTMQATSKDLRVWSAAYYVLTPQPARESDQTPFYAMDGYLARGNLLIGMVKILRDDLHALTSPKF